LLVARKQPIRPVRLCPGRLPESAGSFRNAASTPSIQKKFPNIQVQFTAEPIADMLPKTAVAMASKSDRYDVIHEDYNFVPQFIAQHALEPLEPFLDSDPEYKKDILADIPENVLDLYRDKPAAQGGKLYGLPPDSNCQLQFYRLDVLRRRASSPLSHGMMRSRTPRPSRKAERTRLSARH
jgi:ABC-type glycerol-3-phosphate transport system substrate-binding protein